MPTCVLQTHPVRVAPVGYACEVLCDLTSGSCCVDATASPRDAVLLLLRPLIGHVEVVADPIKLVGEAVECALGVSEKRFEEILLVEDRLIALNGGADFLLEGPNDFFSRCYATTRANSAKVDSGDHWPISQIVSQPNP